MRLRRPFSNGNSHERTKREPAAVRANLGEVLIAQGYQDLTGQIIRSVIRLVALLEAAELLGLRAELGLI